MSIDEVEVYVSSDGLGRGAITRRPDGHFCIYVHWKLDAGAARSAGLVPAPAPDWMSDSTPLSSLYRDIEPVRGVYGTVDDARRELRALPGFREARPLSGDRASN